jgi:hypothetical protein
LDSLRAIVDLGELLVERRPRARIERCVLGRVGNVRAGRVVVCDMTRLGVEVARRSVWARVWGGPRSRGQSTITCNCCPAEINPGT